MKCRHSAVLRDGFTDHLHGSVITAALMGENTQKMQSIGMAGIGLQHLSIELFRLFRRPA